MNFEGEEARPIPAAVIGGWTMVAAALLFVAAFSYLAATFDYPDVLDRPAGEVLPRLLALGNAGRAVWAGYALLPLLLVPAGVGAAAAFGRRTPGAARTALVFAALSALSMTLGLARWPTIHWELARAWADAPDRAALGTVFAGLNAFLGTFVGEFVGELCLNVFFLAVGYALWRDPRRARAFGAAAGLVGGLGMIAMFRNVAPAVGLIAEANNLVLPLGLIVVGVALARSRGGGEPA